MFRESPMLRLVQTLIGKGYDSRILDRNVAIVRLEGANRRYVEEEISDLASLMCYSLGSLLSHAAVVVVGNAGEDARRGRAAARPDQVVIDVTQGTVSV